MPSGTESGCTPLQTTPQPSNEIEKPSGDLGDFIPRVRSAGTSAARLYCQQKHKKNTWQLPPRGPQAHTLGIRGLGGPTRFSE